ncbi:hypothetical protein [Pseudomonas sp. CF161]|uniref:hypothetical protein n=1 Tax=Pseudomonas sp. CF161 TaxID=911241 RepID=UPI0003553CCE|nr:hypothetical protein [Pseudomonas sp. CF161]EPL16158.1 hypothetical protein CF161_01565 [Pseudomonas sp. CF161]
MNTIRLIFLFMVSLLVGLAPFVVAGETTLDIKRVSESGDKKLPKGMQRYVLPLQGCAFEFVAKEGGRARASESLSPYPYGVFSYSRYVNGRKPPSLYFSCRSGAATKVCPMEFKEYRELSAEDIRDIQMRKLGSLNSHYYTEAYISTSTGVAPPRSRSLSLCIGDEKHTLVTENGSIFLGTDPREIWQARNKPVLPISEEALPEVLEIIRSIRFLPADSE